MNEKVFYDFVKKHEYAIRPIKCPDWFRLAICLNYWIFINKLLGFSTLQKNIFCQNKKLCFSEIKYHLNKGVMLQIQSFE